MSNTERAFEQRAVVLARPADWRDVSKCAPTPQRVQLVQISSAISAGHGLSAVIALHAAAIAQNINCVLTTVDPEGPHQLRIALRRTRVALRVFRPVMKGKVNAEITAAARDVGHIVGELRDADVMIDEVLSPAAPSSLLAALNAWRQEVRGRVRAQLSAATAAEFAARLAHGAASGVWSKKSELTVGDVVKAALADFRGKVAAGAARLPHLSSEELHQLRKDVKALRYGTELAVAAGLVEAGSVKPLKRMQDLLGYANDMASLARFDPPIFAERANLQRLRERLVGERADRVSASAAEAAAEWRGLTCAWMTEGCAKT